MSTGVSGIRCYHPKVTKVIAFHFSYLGWLEIQIAEIGGTFVAQRVVARDLLAEAHQRICSATFGLHQILEIHFSGAE